MASLRALRGEIHPGCSCAGAWVLLSSYPDPTRSPFIGMSPVIGRRPVHVPLSFPHCPHLGERVC